MNCKNILEYGIKFVFFMCIYEYMYIVFLLINVVNKYLKFIVYIV